MRVLVTGGAGYIGSHAVRELLASDHDAVVLDDLSTGHRAALPAGVPLVVGDVADPARVGEAARGADVAMHFAGRLSVGESVREPAAYYAANLVKGLAFLDSLIDNGVGRVVFSSTCAVYGEPEGVPIDETHPLNPVNPYGATKLAFERALADYAQAGRLHAIALRYFNAAGCHPDGSIGEDHRPEEHLIPLAIDAALGRREKLTIFGDDYETDDGTCVRDFIHVQDLAQAHVATLAAFEDGDTAAFAAFNLGTGTGFSVRQVVGAVERVMDRRVPVAVGARRPGDPPRLVAAADRFSRRFAFAPRFGELEGIVETTVRWRSGHPQGYGEE